MKKLLCSLESILFIVIFSHTVEGQVAIQGPSMVDAGSTHCYTATSSCANSTGNIYQWSASGGATVTPGGVCLDALIKSNATSPSKDSAKALNSGTMSPMGSINQPPSAAVAFGNTNASISVSACGNSTTLNITVVPKLFNNMTVSPNNQTVPYGDYISPLTASQPSGGDDLYSYQWQISGDDSSWEDISGATNSNYTPSGLQPNTITYYRVEVMSFDYTVYSTAATVTITPTTMLSGGSIANLEQIILYNTSPDTINCSAASCSDCGTGTYHYQWQQSFDGVNFSSVSGSTGQNYIPTTMDNTAYYRRMVTFDSLTAYSDTALVEVQLSPGIISVSPVIINSGQSATLASVMPAQGGNIHYTYWWQESTDQIHWSNLSSPSVNNITQMLFFRRKIMAGDEVKYSNIVRVKINMIPAGGIISPDNSTESASQTAVPMPAYYGITPDNMNYLQTRTFTEPGITDTATANAVTGDDEVRQSTDYYDGLGRLLQTVTRQVTPDQHDLIFTHFYDAFGREIYHYLPYSDSQGSGNFRMDATTRQPAFYDSLFNNTEGFYYSQTTFESSPSDHPLKTTAPGNSWTGSNRGMVQIQRINGQEEDINQWYIAAADSLPRVIGVYQPGTIMEEVATGENGHEVIVCKNALGQVILKKVEISDTLQLSHTGWLCTYYVYDDLGNLRFVIPPKAVNYLMSHNWIMIQAIAGSLCFQYEYDDRRRMILKKIPGSGEEELVYDQRDRPVFSQDSVERENHQWQVTYYDALNRPVETGIYTNGNATRQSLQTLMDGTTGNTSAITYNIPAPAVLSVNSRSGNAPALYTARSSITFLPGFTSGTDDNFSTDIDPDAIESSGILLPADATNPVPPIDTSEVTPLTYTYYDDYSWSGHQAFQSSYLAKTTDGGNLYPETPDNYSLRVTGRVTGTCVRVVNSNPVKWLTTTTYYDDKGRILQTISGNITGGMDVVTNEYDFSGKLVSSYVVNHNNESTITPETRVLTENHYDAAGRLLTVTKTINDDATTKRTIATYAYNELGQLMKKTLGAALDTLHYDYNIRGWLSGINKAYVNASSPSGGGQERAYFGTELDYDYGFNQPQVNGNIAGEKWKEAGDGYERAYGFTYDNANRIAKADFTQDNSGTWNNTLGSGNIDFSVSNLTYDANGNIQSMKQMGLKVNNSAAIDELNYTYNANSNQLFSVTDTIPPPPVGGKAGGGLGDFHDGTNSAGTADYSYDGNGNLTEDLNKNITNIHYNYLNLPDSITFSPPSGGAGGGLIQFVYDATGDKLQKIVTDNTVSPARTTTTDYIDGFEYLSSSTSGEGQAGADTLQFFPTEEGRVRYIPADSTIPVSYVYDYFEKDHLGNIRVVLTEQTKEDTYAATMEPQNATVENQLFDNISSTTVAKPTPGFDNDANNKDVSQLDGSAGNDSQPRVGPSIVLKVMAGDTITIGTYAWYQGTVEPPPSGASNLLNDLLNALTGGVISNSHSLYNTTDNNPNTVLSGDLPQFFTHQEDSIYNTSAPKAFLNWVAFDNQLNMNGANSGVVQVPVITGSEQAQPLVAPEQIIQKDGYIYIYVSNESAQKVYFDNLVIHHNRGPILQENNFYPYGLNMAGISDMAALMPENRQLFNDGSGLQHEEFSDGTGLDWYATPYRNYDPQIGMFHNIDPMPSDMLSPYSYAIDNPLMFEDPSGGITEAYFQHIIDKLGNSAYGGTWTADGGGGGGISDYFGSDIDGFYAGADQMNAFGGWGTHGFAANYNAAAASFYAQTGIYPLQGVSIVQGSQSSWNAARSTIYNEVQESLNELSNGAQSLNNSYSPNDILANIAGSVGFSLNLLEGHINAAQRIGNAFGPGRAQILDLRELPIIEVGSNLLGGLAVGSAAINIYQNGLNLDNETDLLMGIASFIPGPDVIAGLYFMSNIIVRGSTGHTIPYYYLKYTQKVDWNAASSVYVF
ncbi:MAG: hypothetical protein EPN39_13610 [Chitinophagaceae bacterium]|nr:MAG: hypothetical protein EPN39_13610 [Chitinophagaceae bacterium]